MWRVPYARCAWVMQPGVIHRPCSASADAPWRRTTRGLRRASQPSAQLEGGLLSCNDVNLEGFFGTGGVADGGFWWVFRWHLLSRFLTSCTLRTQPDGTQAWLFI